jgi:signal transduction histidine kinase
LRRDSTLDSIGELLSKAMEELHGVIFALRPPDLDDIGVVAAIERYIAQVRRSGLNVQLEAEQEPPPLTPEVRLAIYRIVQEALHNALRHAAADEAVVRFEVIDDMLRVTIHDNGAGFNPQHTARPTALGLLSMRERAAAIGATFSVMSRPGDGTTVTVERPIDPELATVPELVPVDELPELAGHAPKRISA